jgi:hypothetical protein
MPDLGTLLASFRTSAFRLETRDLYQVEQERQWFEGFCRGEPLPELTPENDSWLRLVADKTAAGAGMTRVHIVRRPPSQYVQFELALQVSSVAAGEQIHIVERGTHPELDRADTDFWLFDDQVVVVVHYDDQGRFIGTEQTREVAPYCALRDLALTLGEPLRDYQTTARR